MKTKIIVLTLLVLCASALSLTAEEKRGFLLGVSLGFASPTYSDPMGSYIDSLEAEPDIDRLKLELGLELGYAVTQKTYLVLGIDGVGDRFYDSLDWIQENTYLYYVGIKMYPFDTGLTISVRGGASRIADSSSLYTTDFSDFGYGIGGTLGYDFDKTLKGVSFEIGVGYNYLGGIYFEGGTTEFTVSQLTLYGKLLIK